MTITKAVSIRRFSNWSSNLVFSLGMRPTNSQKINTPGVRNRSERTAPRILGLRLLLKTVNAVKMPTDERRRWFSSTNSARVILVEATAFLFFAVRSTSQLIPPVKSFLEPGHNALEDRILARVAGWDVPSPAHATSPAPRSPQPVALRARSIRLASSSCRMLG